MSRSSWWRICLVGSAVCLMIGNPGAYAWDKIQIQQNYQNTPKGLIIWNGITDKSVIWYDSLIRQNPAGHDTLLQFCQVHHITRIYLFIGSWQGEGPDYFRQNIMPYGFAPDLADLVRKLRNNMQDIRVYALYYLYDDQDRLREGEIENVAHIVNTVIAYNQTYTDAWFDGLMGDCEPDDPTNYPNYLTMIHLAKQAIGASPLVSAVTLRPKWNNQTVTVQGATKTMNQAILDSGDVAEVALMDYANWRQGADPTGNYAGCVNYAAPVFT